MNIICMKEMPVTHFVEGILTDTAIRILVSGPMDADGTVQVTGANIANEISNRLFYMDNDDDLDIDESGVSSSHITLLPQHAKLMQKIKFKKASAADNYSCICCSLEQYFEQTLPQGLTLEILVNEDTHRNVLHSIFDQALEKPPYLAVVYLIGDGGSMYSRFLNTDLRKYDNKKIFLVHDRDPQTGKNTTQFSASSVQGIVQHKDIGTLDLTCLSEFFDKQAIFDNSYLSK